MLSDVKVMSKSLRHQRLQRLQRRIDLKWYENSPFETHETIGQSSGSSYKKSMRISKSL